MNTRGCPSGPAHSLCIESIQSGPGMSTICSIYIPRPTLYTSRVDLKYILGRLLSHSRLQQSELRCPLGNDVGRKMARWPPSHRSHTVTLFCQLASLYFVGNAYWWHLNPALFTEVHFVDVSGQKLTERSLQKTYAEILTHKGPKQREHTGMRSVARSLLSQLSGL